MKSAENLYFSFFVLQCGLAFDIVRYFDIVVKDCQLKHGIQNQFHTCLLSLSMIKTVCPRTNYE